MDKTKENNNETSRIQLDNYSEDLERITENAFANNGEGKIGRTRYPADLIPPKPMPNIPELVSKIQNLVINDISMFAASYLGEKIGDLLSPPNISDMGEQVAYYMNIYKIDEGQIMKTLSTPIEQADEEQLKDDINKSISEMNAEISEKTGSVKEQVDKIVGDVQKLLNPIAKYITKGPLWVEQQVNTIDKNAVSTISETINNQFDPLKKEKEKFVDSQAQKIARKLASKQNEKLYDLIFDKIKKPQQALASAKTQALSVAKESLLNMKATLGL